MKSKSIIVDLKKINPKNEELTVEKLRKLVGKPDIPEEEAREIILAIKVFVSIVLQYQVMKNQGPLEKENNSDNLKTAA